MVDVFFSVTSRTTLDEVLELSSDTPATAWVRQLEWPQEVTSLLEVWTNSVDFVNQVLDRLDTVLTQDGFNNGVVGQWNSLLVDLTVTSLVDQLSDGGQGWVTNSTVLFNQLQQFGGGLGDLDENTRVDLSQSQQLEDLSGLWWDLHDTLDSDNEDNLGFAFNEVGTISLSSSLGVNDGSFSSSVFLDVSFGSLVKSSSLFLVDL